MRMRTQTAEADANACNVAGVSCNVARVSVMLHVLLLIIIIIIIIIISRTTFMVLPSWQSHCESSPGSFDECRTAPSGRRPKTKPDDLSCESACTGC